MNSRRINPAVTIAALVTAGILSQAAAFALPPGCKNAGDCFERYWASLQCHGFQNAATYEQRARGVKNYHELETGEVWDPAYEYSWEVFFPRWIDKNRQKLVACSRSRHSKFAVLLEVASGSMTMTAVVKASNGSTSTAAPCLNDVIRRSTVYAPERDWSTVLEIDGGEIFWPCAVGEKK